MPINIPDNLPAKEVLLAENIFIMDQEKAIKQDIRPLNIAILNLMPEKQKAETHFLRLLGNTALQLNVTLLFPATHIPKTESPAHLKEFYTTFEHIKERKIDGLIITGAPIEHLQFEDVFYWKELQQIMDWSVDNVISTLHICWGAQAGMYHHYGVPKYPIERKKFGIFSHQPLRPSVNIMRGFDEEFYAPHSRHTENRVEDIVHIPELEILSTSEEAGLYMVGSKNGKQIFITGHPEYDAQTLDDEYRRDLEKGLEIQVPKHYYPNDNPTHKPKQNWRSHANLLFANWLNYYVYQVTPYDWK